MSLTLRPLLGFLTALGLASVASAQAPTAQFSGVPRTGVAPLSVSFTDHSTGVVTSWAWTFGDGGASVLQNPSHVYTAAGTYTVSLTAAGPGGSDVNTQIGYVTVLEPAPVAGFTGTPLSGPAPLNVSFSDASSGAVTGWQWSFGDKGVSTLQNPTHLYAAPGTYTVSLTVSGPGGVDTHSEPGFVVVAEPAPTADFGGTPTSGLAPLAVQFTDVSSGAVSGWSWDFGDGSLPATVQNPTHVYATAGTYTVALTVTGPGGTDTNTKPGFISVADPPPVADFSGTPRTGVTPLTVTFSDLTTGSVTAWSWNFGDGATSTLQNPSHVYSAAGVYTVSLSASGPGGSDLQIKADYIVVGVPAPTAGFTGTPLTGVAPLTVSFNETSLGMVTGRSWSFGDGEGSVMANPIHQYTSPGVYSVQLTVTGPGGSDTLLRTNYVTVLEPPPVADFSGSPRAGVAPLTVQFTDHSAGNITGWGWDFGDGGTSTLQNPSHVYATAGTYSVSLTVSSAGGVNSTTKPGYVVVAEPAPVADFSGSPLVGVGTLDVTFTDLSTGSVTARLWDFGDATTSSVPNPVHTYGAPGTYTVSLTVGGPGGFDTMTKVDYVTVAELPPVAGFSVSPTSGVRPLTCAFTDLSTGMVTAWSWDFGDGSLPATAENPTHTYTTAGTYTVTLTVTGPGGADTLANPGLITVAEQPPLADFQGTPTSGVAPLSVAFTDLSTGGPTTSWLWEFGDLATSTLQNPTHTYAAAGTYTVRLTATGPGGSDLEAKLDYVVVSEPAPVSDFTATPLTGVAPLAVSFTDQSTGVISGWSWSFGDGTNSTLQNPTHTYADPGTYTVSLITVGPGGSNTNTKPGFITVNEPPPVARFFGVPQTGTAPLAVSFTDQSVGNITGWSWTFGDGGISTLQNPNHAYSAAGNYTVALTVTSAGGTDTETKLNYIQVLDPPPVADFSGTPTSGIAPLSVSFSDLSTGNISSWSWDFGDLGSSSVPNPVHNYTAPGTYTVALTVTGPGGVSSQIKTDYIAVGDPAPVAEFSATPTSGVRPLTVNFTDLSTGVVTAWSWSFGDGGISSLQNPTHVYSAAGTYTVSLTASGPGGSDVQTKTDYITVAEQPPVAEFSGTPTSGTTPLTVTFTDASTGVVTAWSWSFGDGGTSTLQNPTHTYTASGTYTVSLTATGPGGSDTNTKPGYISVGDLPPVAGFTATPLSGVAPLAVSFQDTTTGIVTAWSWSFGDGGTSTLQNPVHLYTTAGTYTVALTATGPGGSDTATAIDLITVLEPPPVADFTASPLTGSAPLTVNFTDASTGAITSWSWSFGDGGTSSLPNPNHVYSSPGTFTVSLTVTSAGGVDSETKPGYITVDIALDDGSFEAQTPGAAPVAPWIVTGGAGHLIQPDSGTTTDNGFPTEGLLWADLSSDGTNAATPPSNPGGPGMLPVGAAGISQTFSFTAERPVLLFDAAFLLGEPAMSPSTNDFMSVDVSDGTTNLNLYYADTFSTFPAVSARYGSPMTAITTVEANLLSLFPSATASTVLTLRVQVGNGGNALNPSRAYVDDFRLAAQAGVQFRNGSGINPAVYVATPPVIGTNWTATIDTTAFPSATLTFVLTYAQPLPGLNTTVGELLVNTGSAQFFQSTALAGGTHTVPVPLLSSFVGATGYSQGLVFMGNVLLTNAADLTMGFAPATGPPVAAFSATPTTGTAPLSVSFFDQSSGSVTERLWNFGDGTTSAVQNPVHVYTVPGTYSVSLVVSGPGGYDISNQYDLIVVQ